MNKRIGSIINYISALPLLAFGLTYLLKDSFMPYHSEAVSLQWEEVDKNIQFLILALMRAVSGGMILAGFIIIWLQIKFNKSKLKWIPSLILLSGTIVGLTTLYATIIVITNTPGNPPTVLVIACMAGLLIGWIFNRKSININSSN
ncbi:MAG: hypothetical protein ACNA7V_12890 [Bacteroidales bacterium]